jgi:hypothetical protein
MILGNYLLELYGVSAQFDLRVFDESFDTTGFVLNKLYRFSYL